MRYKISLNSKIYEVEVEKGEPILIDEYDAFVPITPLIAAQAAAPAAAPAAVAAPVAAPVSAPAASSPAPAAAPAVSEGEEIVTSPLPGKIFKILVSPGDVAKKGDVLLIIEAMKMENEVFAPRDCTVLKVTTEVDAAVKTGDPLLVLG